MTTLIPFDLEAAKRGEPVVTRDGKRARIVCWDMKGNYPLIVIAPNYDETEGVYAIGINGCFNARESNLDLFMAPKPIKKWRRRKLSSGRRDVNDFLDKLAILRMLLRGAFDQWRNEIWRHDLDQPYCCDGRECGCGAATLRDIYSHDR